MLVGGGNRQVGIQSENAFCLTRRVELVKHTSVVLTQLRQSFRRCRAELLNPAENAHNPASKRLAFAQRSC
jgi:hypothetical protein